MEKFQVYPVQLAGRVVAVSPLLGRGGDFNADLTTLLAWQPDLVLALITTVELQAGNDSNLPNRLHQAGIDWLHLPIEYAANIRNNH